MQQAKSVCHAAHEPVETARHVVLAWKCVQYRLLPAARRITLAVGPVKRRGGCILFPKSGFGVVIRWGAAWRAVPMQRDGTFGPCLREVGRLAGRLAATVQTIQARGRAYPGSCRLSEPASGCRSRNRSSRQLPVSRGNMSTITELAPIAARTSIVVRGRWGWAGCTLYLPLAAVSRDEM